MNENPFYTCHFTTEVNSQLKEIRVDREEELRICTQALIKRKHNVLLYGERGVGKTFLLRLIEEEILKTATQVFPSFVNVASLGAFSQSDDIASFPRAVLLKLCVDLWEKYVNKSYLDLRDRLDESGKEIKLRNKKEKTIQRIYSYMMIQQKESHVKSINTIGVSAGLKGEKKEEISYKKVYGEILPFEFFEFTKELMINVLKTHNKSQVIILCDEANLMPLFKQEEILERYLELFSTKKVQFIFVAGLVAWREKVYLPSCFETRVELKGFSEQRHIEDLIKKYGPLELFSDEAINVLFEAFKGHPGYTIDACSKGYEYAQQFKSNKISASTMIRVIREMDDQRRIYEEEMMREKLRMER